MVANAKFDREVEQLRSQSARMRGLGVLLLEVEAPTVLVAFAAPQLNPPGIVVAVRFDYTDYDLVPPSVSFVEPFTGECLRLEQLHTRMMRGVEQALPAGLTLGGISDDNAGVPSIVIPQELIQAHEGGLPFLCLPGVREYHEHPGHSGDPWELHRTSGAGSLVRLVETVRKYAVEPLGDWGVQLAPRVGFTLAGALPL